MSARPRCRLCRHRPGRRVVTATRKTKGDAASLAEARLHKPTCGCRCHGAAAAATEEEPGG